MCGLPRRGVSVNDERVRWGQGLSAGLVLAIVGVAVPAIFGEHGVTHLLRLRAERRQLGQAAFTLLDANRALRAEIERLRADDLYLEQLARQLGLVRPNEVVYRTKPRGD